MSDIVPNQTIYVNNLNEKVKKEELKKALHAIFSQFGKILDVVCLKTFRLRGQAWIVFDSVTSATNALRQLQGFPFYDKAVRISYAHTKSDVLTKADGTFVPRTKDREKRKGEDREREKAVHAQKKAAASSDDPNAPAAAPKASASAAPAPPHKILFVENLPGATNDRMLAKLFQQFPGYQEVRMVEAKPGIAFVEFESDMQASVAMADAGRVVCAEVSPVALFGHGN
ncbi:hypothetical protein CYMTET_24343 [Cymbomonas tetramitiformis]|uniref:RRM domain-containing protein n=1 Tax=Cymbomonas tetramitiformis TaxID=36881 RepID=A0AAE0L010_9CHLO|nr:hypothetical protein CYMTET_24343 [Cymbomonas tetramitiformis]